MQKIKTSRPSRGIRASERCSDIFFWIKGPTCICKEISCCPVDSSDCYLPQDVQIANVNVMEKQKNYGIQSLMDIFRFNKLFKATAYVICFKNNLRQKLEPLSFFNRLTLNFFPFSNNILTSSYKISQVRLKCWTVSKIYYVYYVYLLNLLSKRVFYARI